MAVSGRTLGRTLGCVVVGALASVGQLAIKPIKPSCCGFAELSWHTSRLAEICLNTSTASPKAHNVRIDKVFRYENGNFIRNQTAYSAEYSPLQCRRGGCCKCGSKAEETSDMHHPSAALLSPVSRPPVPLLRKIRAQAPPKL